MNVGLPPTGGVGTAVRPPARSAPSGPPPEAVAEVRAAARSAERLLEQGRELRFEHDPVTGRIRAELRDRDGNVLRRVPLGEVLDIARGGAA